MPSHRRPPTSPESEPPTPQVELRNMGDRLRATFSALIASMPSSARSVGGLSRWLGVSRATCQRVLEGVAAGGAGADVFARFPGPEALQQLCVAARSRKVPGGLVEAAAAAAEQYQALIASRSRSRRAFVDAVTGNGATRRPAADRRALFDAAVRATGERVAVKSVVAFVRPDPRRPTRLVNEAISSSFGVTRRTDSRPFCPFFVGTWWTRPGRPLPRGTPEIPAASPVEELTTARLRPVSLDSADARLAMVVDFPPGSDHGLLGPIDVAIFFRHARAANPLRDPRARLSIAARINHPVELLVLDVYVHRTLAGSIPNAAVYSLNAPPGDTPGLDESTLWHDRFPEDARLELLGPPATRPSCVVFPRQQEILGHTLRLARVAPDDFIGYRWAVRHPLWQTEYRVSFAFPPRRD